MSQAIVCNCTARLYALPNFREVPSLCKGKPKALWRTPGNFLSDTFSERVRSCSVAVRCLLSFLSHGDMAWSTTIHFPPLTSHLLPFSSRQYKYQLPKMSQYWVTIALSRQCPLIINYGQDQPHRPYKGSSSRKPQGNIRLVPLPLHCCR